MVNLGTKYVSMAQELLVDRRRLDVSKVAEPKGKPLSVARSFALEGLPSSRQGRSRLIYEGRRGRLHPARGSHVQSSVAGGPASLGVDRLPQLGQLDHVRGSPQKVHSPRFDGVVCESRYVVDSTCQSGWSVPLMK